MSDIVVGFDCGASHTRASIWKNDKLLVSHDEIAGLNFDVIGKEEAVDLVMPVVTELSRYQGAVWVVGMAGLDNEHEEKEAVEWWKRVLASAGVKFSVLKVVSDIELVLWAGSEDGVGIGLIAGTGSNCVGRNLKGKEIKVGGMSHIMSDEGSGFSLGWRCLHIITKMNDGRVASNGLLKEVLGVYKKKNIVELKNYLVESEHMKSEVARAAIPLLSAAQKGERLAEEAVLVEVFELVQMVAAVNMRLSPIHHLDLYLAGSLFKNKYYLNIFERKLKATFYDQKVSLVKPLDGVINMAKKL